MRIGMIGLPLSGKTTLFEAVTSTHGFESDRSGAAHVATVTVPDDRMDYLARTGSPKKVTRAHIDFVDVAGVTKDEDRERAQNTLAPVRDVDGLLHVVRFFDWSGAPPHPRGSLDPLRDLQEIETELLIADMDIIERRIEKLEKQIHKATPHQDRDKRELLLMRRLLEALNAGRPVSEMHMNEEESGMLRAFQLLSMKPLIPVLNVGEDALNTPETRAAAERVGKDTVTICAKLEKEIAELAPEEQKEFLDGMGVGEPAARRVIRACYERLGLRSFFTGTGPGEELRAWTFTAGDTALIAAGKIHSDIARGFIRAEVVSYDDLVACGTLKDAKAQNKMSLEGKDYIVRDGDVILFRFKV